MFRTAVFQKRGLHSALGLEETTRQKCLSPDAKLYHPNLPTLELQLGGLAASWELLKILLGGA